VGRKPKVVRQSQNPFKSVKTPVVAVATGRKRIPVTEPLAEDVKDRHIRFRFDMVDHEAEWSLLDIDRSSHMELLKFIKDVETMTVGECEKPGDDRYKTYKDLSGCPNSKVLERLVEEFEGLDYVSRFRLTGKKRLYGLLTGHEFHVLWWDPEHLVWPSQLKNT
jgi:hypothetical protein